LVHPLKAIPVFIGMTTLSVRLAAVKLIDEALVDFAEQSGIDEFRQLALGKARLTFRWTEPYT
jgi:hypothetical protein